jgi:predicted CopG family antitoxin
MIEENKKECSSVEYGSEESLYLLQMCMKLNQMGSKNISISEEAYLRLSELKLKNESFTELIYRLTNKSNVPDLEGIMSEDEGKSTEKNIREPRKMSMERVDRITD